MTDASLTHGRANRKADTNALAQNGSGATPSTALRKMAIELLHLAEQMDGLDLSGGRQEESSPHASGSGTALRTWAVDEFENRRARALVFNTDLFGEPVWDMLLALYCAHVDEAPMRVTEVCGAANVPPTTGLRRLADLESQGLIERQSGTDLRVSYVLLSDSGVKAMTEYATGVIGRRRGKIHRYRS